jgi:hypothetical protein
MNLLLLPNTPRSVYEYELFTSVHQIVTMNFFGNYSSVACTLSGWTISVPGISNISVSITNPNSSILVISGWYEQVFENDYLEYRDRRRTSSIVRVSGFDSLPATYFKATKYNPDQRLQLTADITIFTDEGTIDTTQVVKNNWDYKRTRLTDFILDGSLNRRNIFSDGELLPLPGLIGPLVWKLNKEAGEVTSVANIFTATVINNQTNFNLRTWALNNGWNGTDAAEITIDTDVYIKSTTTSQAALTTGTGWNGLTLINNGFIIGRGGNGGAGGNATQNRDGFPGIAGDAGGPAISLLLPITLDNTNGYIYGGGGGGGGGGGSANIPGDYSLGGGGGGGGIGIASGGAAGLNAGGGTVSAPVAGGVSTLLAVGSGGIGGRPGLISGGDGGNGGTYGTAGANGTNGATRGIYAAGLGGAGGAAGAAIDTNGAELTITGGNNGTQIRGAIT